MNTESKIYVSDMYRVLPPVTDIQQREFTKDARTGIYVLNNDTKDVIFSLDWYCNYLDVIQDNWNRWQEFHYFDLGLIPVSMGPIVYQPMLDAFFHREMADLGVKTYSLEPLTLLRGAPIKNIKDLWVPRKELALALGFSDYLRFSVINDYLRKADVSERWRAVWT